MTIPQTQEHLELVRAAQRGDKSAFRSLYERHRDRVYNLIFYTLADRVWAEDVLQIVFMKVHRGLPDFRFESSLLTWVCRIAMNECHNQLTRRKQRHVPLEAILGSPEEIDADAPPDLLHSDKQRREIIQQAVMELSPKLRSVVALKYFEGLSYEEIAAVLQCAPGTVASRLNRALSQIEERLRPLKRIL